MRGFVCLLIALLLLSPVTAFADTPEEIYRDQLAASGGDELYDQLPQESKDLLRSFGIEGVEPENYTALKPGAMLSGLLEAVKGQSGGVLAACGLILGILLLGTLGESFRSLIREDRMGSAFSAICGAAACATVLWPIARCARQAYQAAEGVAVLMGSYVPAYAAVLAAEGRGATAASFGTVLLTAAELATWVLSRVTAPLINLSLGVGAIGALSEKSRMTALSATLSKLAGRILVVTVSLFTAFLSMQTMVAAPADTLGLRTVKLSLGSFVPLVGGALGEAFGTVTGCLAVLRSTLGMFGIAAAGVLILPSLIRCVLWSAAVGLCKLSADMLGVRPVTALLEAVGTAVRAMMGILLSMGVLVTVSTAVVTLAGRQI